LVSAWKPRRPVQIIGAAQLPQPALIHPAAFIVNRTSNPHFPITSCPLKRIMPGNLI
ncbi:Uncharacterized protein FKW44_003906, partial [Caligus rogercresseyi]